MPYRAEIDGLRALAVLPVIFFHAGFAPFRGGFVGVDVFFVISGYLITALILTERARGSFSLAGFYERRARRILPALILVSAATLPLAWLALLPADMEDYARSLLAVTTFSSNILFWLETGYWGTINALKPLLHTWSLAVEEQYYALYPLALLALWHIGIGRHGLLAAIAAVLVASLVLSQWAAGHMPAANFFLLPTRAWELALGAILGLLFVHHAPLTAAVHRRPGLAEPLGAAGLALILWAVFTFEEGMPFPGLYALVPTMGTALVILGATPRTRTGRLLATRPLVTLGLVSYSAYLWHQPLFAFARHLSLTEPPAWWFGLLTLLALVLAYLTWRFVEQPFRLGTRVGRRPFVIAMAAGSLILFAIGATGHLTGGFPQRWHDKARLLQALDTQLAVNGGLTRRCDGAPPGTPACQTGDRPEIAVWGDSLAMQLVPGILAADPDMGLAQLTRTNCGPILDAAPLDGARFTADEARACLAYNAAVYHWLSGQTSVRTVVLSSSFSQYLGGELLHRDGGRRPATPARLLSLLRNTLSELESLGIQPVIVSPPPVTGDNLGRCLARAALFGRSLDRCDFPPAAIAPRQRRIYRLLDALGPTRPVVRLDRLLCDTRRCRTHEGDIFYYRDGGHLSRGGAEALGRRFDFASLFTGRETRGPVRREGVRR